MKSARYGGIFALIAAVLPLQTALAQDGDTVTSDSKPPTLWTAPSYAVKPVAPKTANPNQKVPSMSYGKPEVDNTDGKSRDPLKDATKDTPNVKTVTEKVEDKAFDAGAAATFEKSNIPTQHIWTRTPQASRAKIASGASQALEQYNRELSDKIVGKLRVPSKASLVESTDKKYNYVLTFALQKNGQVSNIQQASSVGTLKTVALADDQESAMVVKALSDAIRGAVPITRPPQAGPGPWNMVANYDVATGRLFTACVDYR